MSTLLIIAATLLVISFTARAATYTISSYPAGLAEVSCDAFKKNADGSWTQVAILIAAGAPSKRMPTVRGRRSIAGGALIPAGTNFKKRPRPALSRRSATRNRDWHPVPRPQVKSRSANQNALALGGVPSSLLRGAFLLAHLL